MASPVLLGAGTGFSDDFLGWNGAVYLSAKAGNSTSGGALMSVSVDGAAWSALVVPNGAVDRFGAGGGKLYAIQRFAYLGDPAGMHVSSDNGITWVFTPSPAGSTFPAALILHNAGTVCVPNFDSSIVYLSENDGVSWSSNSGQILEFNTYAGTVAPFGYVVVGDGRVPPGSGATNGLINTSVDGVVWVRHTRPVRERYHIATNGDAVCIPILGENIVEITYDGVGWIDAALPTPPVGSYWGGMAWDGSSWYIIAGDSAKCAVSSDLTTWELVDTPASGSWWYAAQSSSNVVFTGTGGSTLYTAAAPPPISEAFWTNRIRTQEII